MAIVVVQPGLPAYRRALFDRMASQLVEGFVVYASRLSELGALEIARDDVSWLRELGPTKCFLPGLEWQRGALSIPLRKGDTLVVSGAPRTVSTLALMVKARLKRVRIIWWGHYMSSTSKPWRSNLRLALMRFADAVVFYTDQEVSEYLASGRDFKGKPMIALNNGVDTTEIERLRMPYAAESRPRDLLVIGRVTPKAGIDLLLRALAHPGCAELQLDVIGDGPSMSEVRRLASDLGFERRIRWHGAIVDEERIAKIVNCCKIFVYPGNVGLSMIHCLAYGLPVVVHDERWLHGPEFAAFRAKENGLSFRHGDHEDLARVVASLAGNFPELDSYSRCAVATIEVGFNVSDMAHRFLSLLARKNEETLNLTTR